MTTGWQVNATYYGCNTTTGIGAAFCLGSANANGLSETGHRGDEWGWVVGAGLRLNFPNIAQGDYFQSQVTYTQGATRYMNQANNAPNFGWERGGSASGS